MPWYEIAFFVAALVVMLIGMLGIILPVIPGVPMILAAAVGYGALTGFEEINGNTILLFIILTVVSIGLDYIATMFGVKKMGGSNLGMIGALIGMVAGLFLPGVGIFGFIIGAFLGAFLFEMLIGRTSREALKAGFGSFLGFVMGGVMRLVIGAVMIGIFVSRVLF